MSVGSADVGQEVGPCREILGTSERERGKYQQRVGKRSKNHERGALARGP
jgi:hypothetical protein